VTFSLLPFQLIPYHKHPIRTVSCVVDLWQKLKHKLSDTVANIFKGEDVSEGLLNIERDCVYSFIQLFSEALTRYKIWLGKDYPLDEFINHCRKDNYCRAEVLGSEYYESNGGYLNNSHFLFGKASQFRRVPG
jgi:hypothetical protein